MIPQNPKPVQNIDLQIGELQSQINLLLLRRELFIYLHFKFSTDCGGDIHNDDLEKICKGERGWLNQKFRNDIFDEDTTWLINTKYLRCGI